MATHDYFMAHYSVTPVDKIFTRPGASDMVTSGVWVT